MNNLLEIKNLNIFFDKYQALYDINLVLQEGSMHALVGESGCGKSITAMSIMQLLPKTARITGGEIWFEHDNLLEIKPRQMKNIRGNKIALIPQDPMTALNPLYTIGNQLVEAITAHSHVTERQALRKAREVLDMVKLPDINNKLSFYPHEFSGGMRQRIIIAMALACNAKLIIADEPTTALDVTIQKQIMDLISEIKKELKTTILLISHDLALVSNYADNISVMYTGHIVEQASAKDFFTNPMHPYSVALINSLPSTNPMAKLKTIEGVPPSIQENISGCRFHPRCNCYVEGVCDSKSPILIEKVRSHYSACLIK